MQYITGIHALNIPCALNTSGDWHASALQWSNPAIADTNDRFFNCYGIEQGKRIPDHSGIYCVANHIRALLDLLEDGSYTVAEGMRKDYICNEVYDEDIFERVYSMRHLENWGQIDQFMEREYMLKWLRYKEAKLWQKI